MENENLLPKPQTDLPLPEKELPAHIETTQPLPVVDGEVKGNKLKYLLLALLAILILGGIAFGAYTMGKKSITPTPTPIANIQPSPTPDPTASWESYLGNGFSFKYPPQYIKQEPISSVTLWDLELNGESSAGQMQLFEDNGTFIAPKSGEFDNPAFFPALITKTIISNEIIEIDSKKVNKIIYSCGTDCQYHAVTFNNGKTNVLFEMSTSGGGLSNVFDQILSTFKFIDSSTNTSDWKTYSNQGFSVNYPPDWNLEPDPSPSTVLFQFNNIQFELPRVSLYRNFEGDWCNGEPTTKISQVKLIDGTSAKKWDCGHDIAIEFSKNGQKYWIMADRITDNTYATVNEVINSIKSTN